MVTVTGNATTGYAGNSPERIDLPRPAMTRTTHRPWCVDCKRKHDADQLDADQRCASCATAAVSRAKAAADRAERAEEIAALTKAAQAEVIATAKRKREVPRRTPTPPPSRGQNTGAPAPSTSAVPSPSPTPGHTPSAEVDRNLEAQTDHAARLLRSTHQHPHPLVAAARRTTVAALEALHLAHELHQPAASTSPPPAVEAAPTTSAGPTGGEDPTARRPTSAAARGHRRDKILLPLDDLATAYAAGATIRDLAAEHHVTAPTIVRALDEAGVVRRKQRIPRTPKLVAAVVDGYTAGDTIDHLAAQLNVSPKVVSTILREQHVTIRPSAAALSSQGVGHPIKLPAETHSDIVRRYTAGESGTSIARAYDCSPPAIYAVLRRHDIQPRTRGTWVGRTRTPSTTNPTGVAS